VENSAPKKAFGPYSLAVFTTSGMFKVVSVPRLLGSKSSDDYLKGNPATLGGPLTSKPTWSNTSRCSATSAFFFAFGKRSPHFERAKGGLCVQGEVMVRALLSRSLGALVANDWFCELSSDRPTYNCPNCKQLAMQFYAQMPDAPEREDAFRCCACGSTWEL
jgi:hypothetical protein